MDAQKRIECVLRGEIPDRVPTFVQQLLPEFRVKAQKAGVEVAPTQMLWRGPLDFSWHVAFGFESGFAGGDSALTPNYDDLVVADLGGGKFLDFYGRVMQSATYNGITNVWWVDGTIKTERDWAAWAHLHPRPLSNGYFASLGEIYAHGRGAGFLPIPICQGLFAKSTEMMTLERFSYYALKKPALIESILDRLLECKLDIIDQYARHHVSVVGVADDVAYKDHTFISPSMYSKYFVPRLRALTDHIHNHHMLVFLHSDGDITPFMPLIITAGFDGVECLEVAAGVDIFSLKQKYGSQITLIGNLDVTHLLTFGTPAEVEEQVRKLLLELKPGGRYIFAPCADIFQQVPVENLMAIKPVLEKFGSYPV